MVGVGLTIGFLHLILRRPPSEKGQGVDDFEGKEADDLLPAAVAEVVIFRLERRPHANVGRRGAGPVAFGEGGPDPVVETHERLDPRLLRPDHLLVGTGSEAENEQDRAELAQMTHGFLHGKMSNVRDTSERSMSMPSNSFIPEIALADKGTTGSTFVWKNKNSFS